MYFNAELVVPDTCTKDPLCEEVKSRLKPGTKLYLNGEFTTSGLKVQAGWDGEIDFTKDKSLVMRKVNRL